MERIDEILTKLREFAERNIKDTKIQIEINDVIRIIDYIDKLEDIQMYFQLMLKNGTLIKIEK